LYFLPFEYDKKSLPVEKGRRVFFYENEKVFLVGKAYELKEKVMD